MTYIDLFAGAGGLSEGFTRAGFKPVAHVEMDEAACYTLTTRAAYHFLKATGQIHIYLQYLRGEISRTELYSHLPEKERGRIINETLSADTNHQVFRKIDALLNGKKADVIIGGPPCQAYSLVGRARSHNGMKDDPRNYLFLEYVTFLKRYDPKVFVFENVLGLRSAGGGEYLRKMIVEFGKAGYDVKDYLCQAQNFGVLQNRKRIIIVGIRRSLKKPFPEFTSAVNTNVKVESLLADLPKLSAGEGKDKNDRYKKAGSEYLLTHHIRNGIDVLTQHVSRPHCAIDKEIYKIAVKLLKDGKRLEYTDLPKRLMTHKNQHSFLDRFKVVNPKAPVAQTVVAHIAKDGHYYIHPDIDQNRSLSVREAARLQSFPDDFYFEGVVEGKNRTAAFKQIGNAVPPLMAYQIAKEILKLIR